MCDNPRENAILANDCERYQLNPGLMSIGRKGNLRIEGEGVEDVHAFVKYRADQRVFTILDVNTCEGTTVNEERLDNCFRKLEHGDCVRFGRRKRPLTFLLTPCCSPIMAENDENERRLEDLTEIEATFDRAASSCIASLEKRSEEMRRRKELMQRHGCTWSREQQPCNRSAQLLLARRQEQQQQQRRKKDRRGVPNDTEQLRQPNRPDENEVQLCSTPDPISTVELQTCGRISPAVQLSCPFLKRTQQQKQQQLLQRQQQQCQGQIAVQESRSVDRAIAKDTKSCRFPQLEEKDSSPTNQKSASKSIGELLKKTEPKYTREELRAKVGGVQRETSELKELVCCMQNNMESKEESLRIMAEAVDKLRRENVCLELQNEALLNSVSRKYADSDGCRREDLMIKKDMENIKLKMRVQLHLEKGEELMKHLDDLEKEVCCSRNENERLKKCLRSVCGEISLAKRCADDSARTDWLRKANIEWMASQVEQLKKPILDMVNLICSQKEGEERIFSTLEDVCKAHPPVNNATSDGVKVVESGACGRRDATGASSSEVGGAGKEPGCVTSQVVRETEKLVRTLEKLSADFKKMKRSRCPNLKPSSRQTTSSSSTQDRKKKK